MRLDLLDAVQVARIAADVASFRRYWRPDGRPFRVRQLGGQGIVIRPHTSDRVVLRTTFMGSSQSHVPPVGDPRLVWDLGSNIGTTIAHMAVANPDVRVIGVELDPDNHALAVRNVQPWRDRVEVIHAAAWTHDGEVAFRRRPGYEAGVKIADDGARAPALSLNSLLARTGPPDYVKMDVEGAERRLLRENTEWARRVGSMKVEVHGSYTAAECADDLRALGFHAPATVRVSWWPRNRGRPVVSAVRRA
jgi:FkbM family methyltransferase